MKIRNITRIVYVLGSLWNSCAAYAVDMPQWWHARGLINTNLTPNDYAPVNIGQLKNVAYQTWIEVTNQVGGVESRMSKVEGQTNIWNAAYTTATNNQSAISNLQSDMFTVYGWGSHATNSYVTGTVVRTESDPLFTNSAAYGVTAGGISNWNVAHSWGNHAAKGYLTNYTENDPAWHSGTGAVYSAMALKQDLSTAATDAELSSVSNALAGADTALNAALGTLNAKTNSWNTAYNWGSHVTNGYVTGTVVRTESDPIWVSVQTNYATVVLSDARYVNATSDTISGNLTINSNLLVGGVLSGNGSGLTNLVEKDPLWNSASGAVYSAMALKQDLSTAATDAELSSVSNALAGADTALNAALGTLNAKTNFWNTAYNWGSHATNGYVTGTVVRTESDPIWVSVQTNYATVVLSDARYVNATNDTISGNLTINSNLLVGGVLGGNGSGLTNLVEKDPLWNSASGAVYSAMATNQSAISNLQSTMSIVYGWGSHTTNAYLTSETDPKVGTNTANYLSKWNGAALVSGSIYDNGNNIGIGTATPGEKLEVAGILHSTSGGIKFPDGSVQATATTNSPSTLSAPNGTPGNVLCVDTNGDVFVKSVLYVDSGGLPMGEFTEGSKP